ncbi:hypothetical protein M3148_08915 [Georgenia satyanarayanai]|uniref:hypothetical protein n=1 Tax=Georgenia satyanarayanai TaxID=860221 RepID=UPI00203F98F3|nr:hypothetical protein [Georgenia satyanarayanai]MCM3661110.1 hypothetical protein [Georgenia satyanarayanai]
MLALGTLFICLSAVAAIIAIDAAQTTVSRSATMRPVDGTGSDASTYYEFAGFDSIDGRPVTVIMIAPDQGPASVLPPGLSQWPAPGHAAVSAELARLLTGRYEGRFGPVDSVLTAGGTETTTELRVYLRPSAEHSPQDVGMSPIAGFGGPGAAESGYGAGFLYAAPLYMVLMLIAVGVALPGAAAVVIAVLTVSSSARRRGAVLTSLGATRGESALIGSGESAVPIAAGVALGAIVTAAGGVFGLRLEQFHSFYPASQFRQNWGALVLALLGAGLLAGLVAVAAREVGRRYRSRELVVAGEGIPLARAAIAPPVILVVIWTTANSQSSQYRTLAFVVGCTVFALLLPSLVAVVLHGIGSLLGSAGTRYGSPAALVGGRGLQRYPGRTARVSAGIGLTVILLGMAQLFASMLGGTYYVSEQALEEYGTSQVTARSDPAAPGVAAFIAAESDPAVAVWTLDRYSGNDFLPSQLVMTCDAAQALDLTCGDQVQTTQPGDALRRLIDEAATEDVEIVISDELPPSPSDQSDTVLTLISRDGGDLDVDHLNKDAYEFIPGGLQLASPYAGSMATGTVQQAWKGWTTLIAALATCVIVIAISGMLLRDASDTNQQLLPITAATGASAWLTPLALIRTTIPVVAASLLGTLGYWMLPMGITPSASLSEYLAYFQPSPTFAMLAIALPSAISVLFALSTAAAQRRDLRSRQLHE